MNTKAVKIHTEFYSFLCTLKIVKSNFFHHHKISQIDSTPFYLLFLHNFITSSFSTATKEKCSQYTGIQNRKGDWMHLQESVITLEPQVFVLISKIHLSEPETASYGFLKLPLTKISDS